MKDCRIDIKKVELGEAIRQLDQQLGTVDLVVAQVMTETPVCINDNTSALDLANMFHSKRFRHLLVCDAGGKLVGLVSDRDLIGCFSPLNPPTRDELAQIPTSVLMSTDLLTISPDVALSHAVNLMLKHGVNSLPVIDEGRLTGILTTTDLKVLLQVFLEQRNSLQSEPAASTSSSD